MKRYSLTIIILSLLMIISSCAEQSDTIDRRQSTALFYDTKELLKQYTDSLKYATDSVCIYKITDAYEEKLTALNMRHSANIDQLMTRGQQDSIIKLTDLFVNIKREKLIEFSENAKIKSSNDSIKADSSSYIMENTEKLTNRH